VGALLGGREPSSRVLVVLTCYLDDSGTDDECPVITMAGYVGFFPGWLNFENAAKAVYDNFRFDVFHAKDFEATKNKFEGWRRIKKQSYAVEIYETAKIANCLELGISFSVLKANYIARKRETRLDPNMSAYGYCFQAIMNHLLRDKVFNEILGRDGVTIDFVIESGNKNDDNIKQLFFNIREKYSLEKKLNAIAFSPKESSRAIQLADFLAYYSRRHVEATEKANGVAPAENFYLELMQKNCYTIGEVATDFHATKPTV
jgi:hypothetical protein